MCYVKFDWNGGSREDLLFFKVVINMLCVKFCENYKVLEQIFYVP